jgi:hypothetical protein
MSCFCPAGVATNIVEQITFYGEPSPPKGPSFPVVDAGIAGEAVADAITDGRFLVLTDPQVADEFRRHGEDLDRYLQEAAGDL